METIETAKKRLEKTTEARNAFYRGVLWAQEWHDLKEVQPENLEWVLCRSVVNDYYIGFWVKGYGMKTDSLANITHWRPIDRE